MHDYMVRFNTATLEGCNFDDAVAMSVLKQGLHNKHLFYSLNKIFSKDYADLLA